MSDQPLDSATRALSLLGDGLVRRSSLAEAAVASVLALLDSDNPGAARSLALALEREGEADIGRLCTGIAAHARKWHSLAVRRWAATPATLLVEHCLVAYVESVMIAGDDAEKARMLRIVQSASLDASTSVQLAARLAVGGHRDAAARLHAAVPSAERADLEPADRQTSALLAESLEPGVASVPPGAVAIGVLDYRQPDQSRASSNLGDYVQTLAMLGHLVRHQSTEFTGDDGLGELAEQMKQDVPESLRLAGRPSRAHLVAVHRDYSTHQQLPPAVWTIAFGWHMHSLFGMGFDFPYHPSVRPIFVSFHVNQIEMLTPDAVAYLGQYAPIGCRDWSTVYLLRSAGVDAFFSGCLTTTVDGAMTAPDPPPPPLPVCGVDVPPRVRANMTAVVREVTHADTGLRQLGLAESVVAARDRLADYRSNHRRMVTARLHAYLPAVSLGLKVRFVPRRPNDPRYPGLRGLEPGSAELAGMQSRIRTLLQQVLEKVLVGADEREVYATWREITAPLVAEADRRHLSIDAEPVPGADAAPLVAAAREASQTYGPEPSGPGVVDVALALDENLAEQLPVCIATMLENASRPLRLWILTRGLSVGYRRWLADAFPTTRICFVPCDHVEYGDIRRAFGHITVSTMDRLLLPDLLAETSRVVYVDVDALVLGDVCELADTNLEGFGIAARSTHHFGHLFTWRCAARLTPDVADELRRRATRRHPFQFSGLNAGIAVMDLDRLRADGFTSQSLAWVERYGLNDQDALMAYSGPDRVDLDPAWNRWPVMEPLDDPRVVHYIGPAKPWGERVCEAEDLWRERAQALALRVAWPPPR